MFIPPALSLFARLTVRPHTLGWAIRYALLGVGRAACSTLLAVPATSASATRAVAPTCDEGAKPLPRLSNNNTLGRHPWRDCGRLLQAGALTMHHEPSPEMPALVRSLELTPGNAA